MHEQESSPGGVHDGHEADELSGRTPQQVANTKAKHDLVLAINGTGSLLHRSGIRKQGVDSDLFAVTPGRASLLLPLVGSTGRQATALDLIRHIRW